MESLGQSNPRGRHTGGTLDGDLVNGEGESEAENDGEGDAISDRDETISDINESIGYSQMQRGECSTL